MIVVTKVKKVGFGCPAVFQGETEDGVVTARYRGGHLEVVLDKNVFGAITLFDAFVVSDQNDEEILEQYKTLGMSDEMLANMRTTFTTIRQAFPSEPWSADGYLTFEELRGLTCKVVKWPEVCK